MRPLALLAIFALAGCAAAPVRSAHSAPASTAYCNDAPSWTVTDSKTSKHYGIFVCFGADNHLLYATRPIPAQAPAKKTARRHQTAEAKWRASAAQLQRDITKTKALAEKKLRIEQERRKQQAAIASARHAEACSSAPDSDPTCAE